MRTAIVAALVAAAAAHGVSSGSGSGGTKVEAAGDVPEADDTFCPLNFDVSAETCLLPNAEASCEKDDDGHYGGCIDGYTLQKTGGDDKIVQFDSDGVAQCQAACAKLGRDQKFHEGTAANECLCTATLDEMIQSMSEDHKLFQYLFIGSDGNDLGGVTQHSSLATLPATAASGRMYLYHCTECEAEQIMDQTRPKPTGAMAGGIAGPFAAIAFLVFMGKEY